MELSTRVAAISESVTLKLNSKAVALAETGKKIYNLTAGQLPFRPSPEFVDLIRSELDFIKSYHYSPVSGFPELRSKICHYFEESRGVSLEGQGFSCVVSNGGKHAISNVLGALINPGDEVVVLAPYWVSYPEIVKFTKGVPVVVSTSSYEVFTPSIDDIRAAITDKTKVIIVNSPQNPTGIHYNDQWMEDFAGLMKEFPEVNIISDEIYYELYYFDPKPTYFYQKHPELLKQTIIIDGISKNLASTGLRIGWAIGPENIMKGIDKLQGQTTSGANSLMQRALINFEFNQIGEYLEPVKKYLRVNAQYIRDTYRDHNMSHLWYQSTSAFYYLVDFSNAPVMSKFKKGEDDEKDYSFEICEALLNDYGLALVPGGAFGMPNAARISLVLEKGPFQEAIDLLLKFIADEK